MAEPAPKRWTIDEFLAWDDGTDRRHELVGGSIVAMAPPSEAHGTIVANLTILIGSALQPPCRVVGEAGIVLPERDDTWYTRPISRSPAPAGARSHAPRGAGPDRRGPLAVDRRARPRPEARRLLPAGLGPRGPAGLEHRAARPIMAPREGALAGREPDRRGRARARDRADPDPAGRDLPGQRRLIQRALLESCIVRPARSGAATRQTRPPARPTTGCRSGRQGHEAA